MKKRIFALAVILMLVIASIAYFAEASIYYWGYPYQIQRIDDKWFTIDRSNNATYSGTFIRVYCKNNGLVDCTFGIIVKLTNATFLENFIQSSELINSTAIKLLYSLHGQEETFTDVYFAVNDNSTHFVISIALATNQLFIRSTEHNWAGQNEFPYSRGLNDTWSAAMIS